MNIKVKKVLVILVIILIALIGIYFIFKPKPTLTTQEIAVINKYSSSNIGATFPTLLYADCENVIFYDYPGLIVYNLKKNDISSFVDFEELNYSTQGSDATEIFASSDGKDIYFIQNETVFVYNVKNQKMIEKKIDTNSIDIFKEYFREDENLLNKLNIDRSKGAISDIIQIDSDTYVYLTLVPNSYTFLDLNIVLHTPEDKNEIAVFLDER